MLYLWANSKSMKNINLLLSILILAFVISCNSERKNANVLISKAQSIVEHFPDSALALLELLDIFQLNERQNADYIVTKVQAKDKCILDISSDTLIFGIADYFITKDMIEKATLALFYSGRVYQANNNYENAMLCLMLARDYSIGLNNSKLSGLIFNDIGYLKYMENNFDDAIMNFKYADKFFEINELHTNRVAVINSIANSFLLNNEKDSAYYYYLKAIDICNLLGDKEIEKNLYINFGVLFVYLQDYSNSLVQYNRALELSKDKVDSCYIFTNIAQMYYSNNLLDSAYHCMDKGLSIFDESYSLLSNDFKVNFYGIFSLIEEGRGNFEQALKMQKEKTVISDLIMKEISSKKILEIENKYDFEKIENEKATLILERQKTYLLVAILIIACLSLLVIVFYFNRKIITSRNELLKSDNKILTLQKMVDNEKKIAEQTNSSNIYDEQRIMLQRFLSQQFQSINKMAKIQKELENGANFKVIANNIDEILYSKSGRLSLKLLQPLLPDIMSVIQDNYPKLKDLEMCICCLLYFGFENGEIQMYFNLNPDKYFSHCYRIRNKLSIESRAKIGDFLLQKFN